MSMPSLKGVHGSRVLPARDLKEILERENLFRIVGHALIVWDGRGRSLTPRNSSPWGSVEDLSRLRHSDRDELRAGREEIAATAR